MSYATVTLTGSYKKPDGTAETGVVKIVPSTSPIIDAGGNVVLAGAVTVQLTAGAFSVSLPATDDTNLNPSGFGYTVTAHLGGSTVGPTSFALPASPSTVDMADVTSVDPSTFTPGATYLAAGNNLGDLTDPAAARGNLGVGLGAASPATDVVVSSDTSGAALVGQRVRITVDQFGDIDDILVEDI